MKLLDIGPSYSRAFDLVYVPSGELVDNLSTLASELILIELKTTKKKLVNNPDGFFFGATENEFRLAEHLGDRYSFCFVSLHVESLSHSLLTLTELNERVKTKRVQYQINL